MACLLVFKNFQRLPQLWDRAKWAILPQAKQKLQEMETTIASPSLNWGSWLGCFGLILRSVPQPSPHPTLINKYKGNAFRRGLASFPWPLTSEAEVPSSPRPLSQACALMAQRHAGSHRLTWPAPAAPAGSAELRSSA